MPLFLRDPHGLVMIFLHRSYKHSKTPRLTFLLLLFDHKTLPTCTPARGETRSYHCLVAENPPLHEGHFCFKLLTLLEFSASIIPKNCLEFPLLSQLVGYPLERIFRQKMKAVALYFYKNLLFLR